MSNKDNLVNRLWNKIKSSPNLDNISKEDVEICYDRFKDILSSVNVQEDQIKCIGEMFFVEDQTQSIGTKLTSILKNWDFLFLDEENGIIEGSCSIIDSPPVTLSIGLEYLSEIDESVVVRVSFLGKDYF